MYVQYCSSTFPECTHKNKCDTGWDGIRHNCKWHAIAMHKVRFNIRHVATMHVASMHVASMHVAHMHVEIMNMARMHVAQ